jgi:CRP/FNR family transcriptional regulator, cyclic AMP receptor protein
MRQPAESTLRDVAIFKGLPAEDRQRFERLCAFRTYQRGKTIVHVHDKTREVFFLIGGRARVIMYSRGGKPVSFREIGPGEMFGEFAAIDEGPRSTGVEVLETSLVASASGRDFRAMLRAHPLVMEAVLVRVVAQIRALTTRVFEFSTQAVNNRIDAEILRLARTGGVDGRQARISPFPKHGDIASRISTHREAVTRRLSYLEDKKLIQRSGATLVVNDVSALERMVQDAIGE